MRTATYKDLMNLGFPEHTSRDIIREAKKIAVKSLKKLAKLTIMRYN